MVVIPRYIVSVSLRLGSVSRLLEPFPVDFLNKTREIMQAVDLLKLEGLWRWFDTLCWIVPLDFVHRPGVVKATTFRKSRFENSCQVAQQIKFCPSFIWWRKYNQHPKRFGFITPGRWTKSRRKPIWYEIDLFSLQCAFALAVRVLVLRLKNESWRATHMSFSKSVMNAQS